MTAGLPIPDAATLSDSSTGTTLLGNIANCWPVDNAGTERDEPSTKSGAWETCTERGSPSVDLAAARYSLFSTRSVRFSLTNIACSADRAESNSLKDMLIGSAAAWDNTVPVTFGPLERTHVHIHID